VIGASSAGRKGITQIDLIDRYDGLPLREAPLWGSKWSPLRGCFVKGILLSSFLGDGLARLQVNVSF
jgi:hypothetical protein